ncbi:MAG TPA: hypothetical protein VIJ49_07850 [Aestuariivirga sp.]
MKAVNLLFEFTSICAGLFAAYLWYKASKVEVIPAWAKDNGFEPVDEDRKHSDWIGGILEATNTSGKLNKTAALWTAGSLILNAFTSIVEAYLHWNS